MRKINCDCCDKKVKEWINYVYPYFIGGNETGKAQYANRALLLCKSCCIKIEMDEKKPKNCNQIIGTNSEIVLDQLQRMVFKNEKIPYQLNPNVQMEKRTDGKGWYYYDPCIC